MRSIAYLADNFKSNLVRDDGGVSVRYVCEGARVHEDRRVLDSLQRKSKIWYNGGRSLRT
jgi:hypothetical protein